MIVLDASAAIIALFDPPVDGARARAALADDLEWYAPAVFGFEVMHHLRRAALQRSDPQLAKTAEAAAAEFLAWPVRTFDSPTMLSRVWQLRHNVDASDAFYVAAAEQLGCALLTADERLSKADGPRCPFRLISAA